MMSMKFSEIMLDLDTGDASIHDVHAKEALGKVNVSSAIFEYAAKLAELPANSSFIQEAADEAEAAGLPTDPAEATGLATEAVAQELIGFYDVVVENAKKVKAAADRDMKAIIGLGKKYGISASAATSGNFMIAFAKPLAQALVRDFATNRKFANRIKFKKGIFPDSSLSEGLIFSYGNCMARLASVFGMNIGDCIEDPTVQEVLSLDGNFIKFLKAGVVGIIGDPAAANAPKTGFNKGGVGDVDYAVVVGVELGSARHCRGGSIIEHMIDALFNDIVVGAGSKGHGRDTKEQCKDFLHIRFLVYCDC
jgi:hypothetical protein